MIEVCPGFSFKNVDFHIFLKRGCDGTFVSQCEPNLNDSKIGLVLRRWGGGGGGWGEELGMLVCERGLQVWDPEISCIAL